MFNRLRALPFKRPLVHPSNHATAALRHRRGELGKQVARQGELQSPSDCHRPLTLMAHVGCRAKEPKRSVIGSESTKQHDAAALFGVMLVAEPGFDFAYMAIGRPPGFQIEQELVAGISLASGRAGCCAGRFLDMKRLTNSEPLHLASPE